MSVAIGIDLGTTNTVVAAVVDGVAVTLEDDGGRRLLPSVVSFHPSSTVLVGDPARERRLIDPENTVDSIKPLLGRSWDSAEVTAARARFPFQLTQGAKNSTMVTARDVQYALPEISAFVLRRAKSIAEAALGQAVDRAVITVPANFNDLQRASTKIAGKLAGLEVMRILNEPTAAALAYGQSISKSEKIGVYDLGGGTFDITLLDLTGNVFEVLATAGDTSLGGDDIDRVLADRIAIEVLKKFKIDPRSNPQTAARLTFLAEDIKKALSGAASVRRDVTGIGFGESGKELTMPFTLGREELEHLTKPLVDRTINVARQSMEIVGLAPRNFDRVILVGGSTRMPLVARMVEQLFGQPPHLKVNPDEVVALGAAIQAHALNRSKSAHKRRTSAHDQLARSQTAAVGAQAPTRPPNADPLLVAKQESVPRAPPVPTNIGAAPPPAPAMPEFLTFNKAPAVISFSDMPGMETSRPLPARPPGASAPPPLPQRRQNTLPQASVLDPVIPDLEPCARTGASDHAGALGRPSGRPIEGAPARAVTPQTVGPKPARKLTPQHAPPEPGASGARQVPAGHGSGVGAWGDFDAHGAIVAAPEPNFQLPSGMPAAVVMQAGFEDGVDGSSVFNTFELQDRVPAFTPERFQQGSAIATSASTPLLIDVTPLSLGVETAGGYSDVLIPANSPVPCEKTRTFLTASDGQTAVFIRVAQGESAKFAQNTRLGDLELSGLRRATRGEVKITVTFELDADGILKIRARDQDTARETTATMRLVGGSGDADDLGVMQARQARHIVA